MIMPSESVESRKMAKPQNLGVPPLEQEHLLCPRCDSMNTKFCYYNNYNFSQPRHFCKTCRRYWTEGGTLRDIPFGGGSRKNAKQSRTVASTPSVSVSAVPVPHLDRPLPHSANAVPALLTASHCLPLQFAGFGNIKQSGNVMGSFPTLPNTQGPGLLALGGFGVGLGSAFEDVGFGVAKGGWSFATAGEDVAENGSHANASGMGNMWRLQNGEGVFVPADCFPWPDFAISAPGNGLK